MYIELIVEGHLAGHLIAFDKPFNKNERYDFGKLGSGRPAVVDRLAVCTRTNTALTLQFRGITNAGT